MRIEMTQCDFCVALTDGQWKALTAINKRADDVHRAEAGRETPGIKRLMKAGCLGVEWNGHYGRNFFFKAGVEDVKRAKKAVRRFIGGLVG